MNIRLCDIKEGQEFWECAQGYNVHLKALHDATQDEDGGWSVSATLDNGDRHLLFHAKGREHYGPSLYSQPRYVETNRNQVIDALSQFFPEMMTADPKDQLIVALEDYISYLSDCHGETCGYLNAHGWKWNPELMERGRKIQERISKLKEGVR